MNWGHISRNAANFKHVKININKHQLLTKQQLPAEELQVLSWLLFFKLFILA